MLDSFKVSKQSLHFKVKVMKSHCLKTCMSTNIIWNTSVRKLPPAVTSVFIFILLWAYTYLLILGVIIQSYLYLVFHSTPGTLTLYYAIIIDFTFATFRICPFFFLNEQIPIL